MAFYTDFAGHYDEVFPLRGDVLKFLERELPAEGKVLDVGCGTGACCGHLTKPGRTCLGIDLDPGMIAQAESRYPEAEFRILGMQEVGLLPTGGFAAVICLGNVLPHLPLASLPGFLAAVHRLLRPGGAWVFQTVNFDPVLERKSHVFPIIRVPGNGLAFHRAYENITPGRMEFVTALTDPDRIIFRGREILYPLTSVSYRALHPADRWTPVLHHADFNGRPFEPESDSGSIWAWRRR
ncbi:MAG: class I SAM-dependent methyltransferase [bacterium]|jgi:SAM-dependent methyltransferase|nr:class I SAM-dependent methyltransferase [bacterium]MBK7045029.1 class I SAM-dependent methyltransferase [bacterium]MBK7188914.1 class I SAM-dependent methyltransferase [bacterium]MBK7672502.1 class I SAM-dependent methyltransferase [bacterium]MBK7769671.1 class I SAM-dependent methyltransferase [bacterium]